MEETERAIFADFDRRYSRPSVTGERLQAAMDQQYEDLEKLAVALKTRGEMEPRRVTDYGEEMETDRASPEPHAHLQGVDDGITSEMIDQGVAILENAGFASDSFFTREIVREILRFRDCRS